MKTTIIVPSYNESEGVSVTAKSMKAVVSRLAKKCDVEVIFVNDGSRDNTSELLRAEFEGDPVFRVIDHEVNQGLGAAIRTGFKASTGDVIVTTDFDGTYKFDTIPDIIDMMLRTGADVVSASPYHPNGAVMNVPKYRLMFSYGASSMYRMFVSPQVHTWTALFRVYRRSVIENIEFKDNGFLSVAEILVNTVHRGYRVVEFPTVLHSRAFGASSIRIAKVTAAHLRFQFQIVKTVAIEAVSSRLSSFMSPAYSKYEIEKLDRKVY